MQHWSRYPTDRHGTAKPACDLGPHLILHHDLFLSSQLSQRLRYVNRFLFSIILTFTATYLHSLDSTTILHLAVGRVTQIPHRLTEHSRPTAIKTDALKSCRLAIKQLQSISFDHWVTNFSSTSPQSPIQTSTACKAADQVTGEVTFNSHHDHHGTYIPPSHYSILQISFIEHCSFSRQCRPGRSHTTWMQQVWLLCVPSMIHGQQLHKEPPHLPLLLSI